MCLAFIRQKKGNRNKKDVAVKINYSQGIALSNHIVIFSPKTAFIFVLEKQKHHIEQKLKYLKEIQKYQAPKISWTTRAESQKPFC